MLLHAWCLWFVGNLSHWESHSSTWILDNVQQLWCQLSIGKEVHFWDKFFTCCNENVNFTSSFTCSTCRIYPCHPCIVALIANKWIKLCKSFIWFSLTGNGCWVAYLTLELNIAMYILGYRRSHYIMKCNNYAENKMKKNLILTIIIMNKSRVWWLLYYSCYTLQKRKYKDCTIFGIIWPPQGSYYFHR